ncbi:MAG: protein kinase [Candidatus Sumerlaeia bacterium]|nr:protein kinase [Candidatus Sumerlaeia bacterium]
MADFFSEPTKPMTNAPDRADRLQPPPPPRDERLGTEVNGRHRYRIVSKLGKGGFGAVYLAETLVEGPGAPPPHVAIKFFENIAGMTATSLVKRELSALMSLRSSRIPAAYDWHIGEDTAFMVSQYYPDASLVELLDRVGTLSEEAVWRFLEDILSALHDAHRAGFLHLDIKPSNILCDGNGGFVLADFGLAQAVHVVEGKAMTPGLGTRGYRAPEQRAALVEEFDLRTDLYGVGATAWSILTGIELSREYNLFQDYDPENKHAFPRPSRFVPQCSPFLEETILNLVSMHPSDRPGSSAEVLRDIRNHTRPNLLLPPERGSRGENILPTEVTQILDELMDPLWCSLLSEGSLGSSLVRFDEGEYLGKEGEESYRTFILLKGRIEITRRDVLLIEEEREGTFLGEIASLTGTCRTASMRAKCQSWLIEFNTAELERFVLQHPAIASRLIRSLAERLRTESIRATEVTPMEPDEV